MVALFLLVVDTRGAAQARRRIVEPSVGRLRLTVQVAAGELPAVLFSGMCRELQRRWSGYDVLITCSKAGQAPAAGSAHVLRLHVASGDLPFAAHERTRPIAAIVFEGKTPTRSLFASVSSAQALARQVPGVVGSPAIEEALTARVLGRAVAHEVGHYLLGSREHHGTGLMRAAFDRRDVISERAERMGVESILMKLLAGRRSALQAAAGDERQ